MRAVYAQQSAIKRTARRYLIMSDNCLIGHFCHYREMSQIIAQNSENHVAESSAPPESTAAGDDVSAPQSSAGISMHSPGLPSPLPEASAGLPVHLEQLADRARGYVEAASSAPTPAKLTPPTGSILPAGAGARVLPMSRRARKPSGFTSPPAHQGPQRPIASPIRS